MENHILDMSKLKPSEFRTLDRRHTVAVVPFSPIEYHGDHLPLGTDYIFAGEVLRSAAAEFIKSNPDWKFMFTPVFPLGADTVPHGGSLSVKKSTLADVADQISEQLIKYGFRYIALFSGHGGYGQILALEETAAKKRKKHAGKKTLVFSPLTYLLQRTASKEFVEMVNKRLSKPLDEEDLRQMTYESHGGKVETSYILSVAPELMDERYKTMPPIEPEPNIIIKSTLETLVTILPNAQENEKLIGVRMLTAAMTWFFSGAKNGYLGNPARASVEFGLAIRGAISELFCELFTDVLINNEIPECGGDFLIALKLLAH
ncbi:MAG TPA: creatininase family protein [bacterium]|nr:creatininase family protein [bacterium]